MCGWGGYKVNNLDIGLFIGKYDIAVSNSIIVQFETIQRLDTVQIQTTAGIAGRNKVEPS